MKDLAVPVLALDGPSGSGKGTVALAVAAELGWNYLDSGAIYRVLARLAQEAGVELNDEKKLLQMTGNLELRFTADGIFLGDRLIGDEIRSESAGKDASVVAAIPSIRQALLNWQRRQAVAPGLVADGRDMGTVVFPQSDCKIFLTASAGARAERRFNQLRLKGFDVNMRALFGEITERDERDANRAVSPLKPASDATVLDTTDMPIAKVIDTVLEQVRSKYRGSFEGSA